MTCFPSFPFSQNRTFLRHLLRLPRRVFHGYAGRLLPDPRRRGAQVAQLQRNHRRQPR
jgi:hypothetical protein